MLIITKRHKKKDLILYEDYKYIDNFTNYSENKKNNSIFIIKNWIDKNKNDVRCMTSWGKDSIVLLHLLFITGIKIPVVFVKNPRYNPDCLLVRDEFLKKYDINYHEIEVSHITKNKGKKNWDMIDDKFGKYRIIGIRNDESNIRKMIFKIYGHNSKFSCRPLSLWKIQEIFSYIEKNNLPLCPVYGYLGEGFYKRDLLRTHSIVDDFKGNPNGKEWEKKYYPDILNKLQKNIL
jgi:phosphoadenosine phosphosulfate reductase